MKKNKKRQRTGEVKSPAVQDGVGSNSFDMSSYPLTGGQLKSLAIALSGVFLWSYWPNLVELVQVWNSDPDYSHGYLVAPLAVACLWANWQRMNWKLFSPSSAGLILIAFAILMRYYSDKYYFYELATLSIIPWLAGCCWLLGGRRFFLWTLPWVVFLGFAMKLPARLENGLSAPLKRLATEVSCWILQVFGQPAFPQGNTILFNEHRLEVADACAGLRMSLGIVALTYAFILLVRKPLWQKIALGISAIPIAIIANALRIVGTGFLYQYFTGEAAQRFLHDISGFVMIPIAVVLLFAALAIIDNLTIRVPLNNPNQHT